jgi:adenylate cyclase
MKEERIDYSQVLQAWGQSELRLQEETDEYLYSLTGELNQIGLNLGLATVLIRTPHPQLDMLVIRWRPLGVDEVPTKTTHSILSQRTTKREDGVQDVYPLAHGHTDEEMWRKGPFHRVIESKEFLRVPLCPAPDQAPFPIVDDLVARGMTDYLVFPVPSAPKVTVALSLATQRAGGFPSEFLEALKAALPLLSLSLAYNIERFLFQQVLSAYIGEEPASLVFNGQIHQGDLISRNSALGFADLRGFTAASERLPRDQLVNLINSFFEHVYIAVYRAGGEILKFMGDGVLFIVPDEGDAAATCDRALEAVTALIKRVQVHNQEPSKQPIRFGCALHYGEVLYGNMGSPARLDFTVMGPTVNLTARIESLTGQVGETCLLSERFDSYSTGQNRLIGDFEFKGVSGRQTVYAPGELDGVPVSETS